MERSQRLCGCNFNQNIFLIAFWVYTVCECLNIVILGYIRNKCLVLTEGEVVLVCGDIPQALPLIGLHREPGQSLHATVNPQTVTNQHVHDPLQRQRENLLQQ